MYALSGRASAKPGGTAGKILSCPSEIGGRFFYAPKKGVYTVWNRQAKKEYSAPFSRAA